MQVKPKKCAAKRVSFRFGLGSLPAGARCTILVGVAKDIHENVEPLYEGLKARRDSTLPLGVRVALAAVFLIGLAWIVWLQAH